jgi:hypothetical protein
MPDITNNGCQPLFFLALLLLLPPLGHGHSILEGVAISFLVFFLNLLDNTHTISGFEYHMTFVQLCPSAAATGVAAPTLACLFRPPIIHQCMHQLCHTLHLLVLILNFVAKLV